MPTQSLIADALSCNAPVPCNLSTHINQCSGDNGPHRRRPGAAIGESNAIKATPSKYRRSDNEKHHPRQRHWRGSNYFRHAANIIAGKIVRFGSHMPIRRVYRIKIIDGDGVSARSDCFDGIADDAVMAHAEPAPSLRNVDDEMREAR